MPTAAARPSPSDTRQPLRRLLAALACESGELARSADQLQHLFGQLMAEAPSRPHDALERAQALDALVQRLQGLQVFLAGLSAAELSDVQTDTARAAARLRLTSQARRFSPEAQDGAAAFGPAGDCDLF